MTAIVFWVVLAAIALNIATTAWSIARPQLRVWPPPGETSWQYRYTLTVSIVWMLGFLALGILDWNSFVLGHWARYIVGATAIVGGVLVSQRAVHALSLNATRGLAGDLVTNGPYRYSRNPQYVAYIAVVLGYAVSCNSGLSLAAASLAIVSFLLGPFAEEPWLRERLGARYEEYAAEVPRFVGKCGRRTSAA